MTTSSSSGLNLKIDFKKKLHRLGTCKGPDSPPNFQAWAMCGWLFTIWVSIICTFVQLKGPALAATFSSNAIEKQHLRFICVKSLFYTNFVFKLHLWVLKYHHSASRLLCCVKTLISSFTGHSGNLFYFFTMGRSWAANAKQQRNDTRLWPSTRKLQY